MRDTVPLHVVNGHATLQHFLPPTQKRVADLAAVAVPIRKL
jgi:hypothetical protein